MQLQLGHDFTNPPHHRLAAGPCPLLGNRWTRATCANASVCVCVLVCSNKSAVAAYCALSTLLPAPMQVTSWARRANENGIRGLR